MVTNQVSVLEEKKVKRNAGQAVLVRQFFLIFSVLVRKTVLSTLSKLKIGRIGVFKKQVQVIL